MRRLASSPEVVKEQQARGVEVQPPDRDPAAAAQARQGVEDGGTAIGIVTGDDTAFRLVIEQHAGRPTGRGAQIDETPIDLDPVGGQDELADLGRLRESDAHPPGGDPFLHVAAGSDAGLGQHLVQALGFGAHPGRAGSAAHRLPAGPACPTPGGPGRGLGSRRLGGDFVTLRATATGGVPMPGSALPAWRKGVRLGFMVEFQSLANLFEGRQLAQAAQAQVVEEAPCGGEECGAAGGFAMTDHIDPAPFFQGFDDVCV